MGTEVICGYNNLEEELQKAKNNLRGLNDNIKKIVGRDPTVEQYNNNARNDSKKRNSNAFDSIRRNDKTNRRYTEGGAMPAKRRILDGKSVFSRLSGPPSRDEIDYNKPRLHSRVIKEQPTRQEIVAAQGSDEQSRARNKRMFGSLLGTLQKFSQEESRLKPKEEKKAQIEKKLEEQALKERENLRKEKQCLFSDRKRQQLEIKTIELKMIKVKELEKWELSKKPLANFIRTKAEPHLFYMPKTMNTKSTEKLTESRNDLEKIIQLRRQEVQEEIAIIDARFQDEIKSFANNINVEKGADKHERSCIIDDTNFEEEEEHQSPFRSHSDVEDDNLNNFKIIIRNTDIKQEKMSKIESDDRPRGHESSSSSSSQLPTTENLQITFTTDAVDNN